MATWISFRQIELTKLNLSVYPFERCHYTGRPGNLRWVQESGRYSDNFVFNYFLQIFVTMATMEFGED